MAVNPEPAIAVHGEGSRRCPPTRPTSPGGRSSCSPSAPTGIPTSRSSCARASRWPGGMAGGSADAAAALVGLSALWKLDLSRDELSGLAAELGSDVTFALHGGTALGTGRGEQIVPVLSRHTQHWVIALHRAGLVHAHGVRRAGPPPRRRPAARAPRRAGAGGHRGRRPAPARPVARQRPAARGHQPRPRAAPHPAGGRRRGRPRRARLRVRARRARSCARAPRRRSTSPPSWRAWACAARSGWRTARCRAPASSRPRSPALSWPPVRA